MVTMDIAPVMALVLNILSKLISADDVSVRGEELSAVFGPSVLLGLETCGLSHLENFIPVSERPGELLLDQGCAAGRNEQAVLVMLDEVGAAGAGGAENGDTAGHGLEDNEPEAFGD